MFNTTKLFFSPLMHLYKDIIIIDNGAIALTTTHVCEEYSSIIDSLFILLNLFPRNKIENLA